MGTTLKINVYAVAAKKKMLAIDRQCLNITKIEAVKPEIVTS